MNSKHTRSGTIILAALCLVFSSCAMHPNVTKRDAAWMRLRAEGQEAAQAECRRHGLEKWCWSDLEFWATVDRR